MEKTTATVNSVNFRETRIPQEFSERGSEEIYSENGGTRQRFAITMKETPEDHSCDATDNFGVTFMTIASIMAQDAMKPKDGKSALVFTDYTDINQVIFACIAEYVKDDTGEGNWYYSFIFDPKEDDLKDIKDENKYVATNAEKIAPFTQLYNAVYRQMHCRGIYNSEIIYRTVMMVISTIRNWLDENAKEGEVTEIVFTDVANYSKGLSREDYMNSMLEFATFSVEIVKGQKIMTGQFGETLKAIAKGNGDSVTTA